MSRQHFPAGSMWRRWDVHLHAPGTALNDQFTDWETYLTTIENACPAVSVLGITDYLSTRCYEAVLKHKRAGRLPNVELLFPNIEFRITPETKQNKGINVHILVSPHDERYLIRIYESLSRLVFKYKADQFPCTPDGLTRLGHAHKAGLSGDDAAFAEGVKQFKLGFEAFREWWFEETWLNANALIAVDASSDDGVSGLQYDSGFAAVRTEIYRFAQIIFSGNPKDRAYWLGDGTDSVEVLRDKYGGPKPCLHGCDAHDDPKLLKPDVNRLCWIKADPTFEGLRQTIYEPDERVHIGDGPPLRHNQDAVIERLTFPSTTDWFEDEALPLNPGLVCIIGQKGSGKTAVADFVAHAGGVVLDRKESFLYRARDYLEGSDATITWASDRVSSRPFPDESREEDEPELRYLPQKFVERLCSGMEIGDELGEEIEAVIFAHLEDFDTLEASSFAELREIRTQGLQKRRIEIRGELNELNADIASIDSELRAAPAKKRRIKDLEKQHARLEKQYPKIEDEVSKKLIKRLNKLMAEAQKVKEEIAALEKRKQCLEDLRRRVQNQVRSMASFWKEIQNDLESLGIPVTARDAYKPQFQGDIETPISRLLGAFEKQIQTLKQCDPSDTSRKSPNRTLDVIASEQKQVEKQLKLDESTHKLLFALRKQATQVATEQARLERELKELETTFKKRRGELADSRFEIYLEHFTLLEEERQSLETLYEPLRMALSDKAEHERRLEIYIRTVVNVETWAARGEELFDSRKEGAFYKQKNGVLAVAKQHLLGPWQNRDTEQIKAGVHAILQQLKDTGGVHAQLRENVKLVEVADWLFSVDHIALDYGLRYEGAELQHLSPGTKGIVLLILYLAIDQSDERPLIVDQPDENLDNQSIYEILRAYFREAKVRRQIIIVTHNPNLVVNTNADQIIVAHCDRSASGLPRMRYFSGSLECMDKDPVTDRTIRDEVCRLLEGGREAFEMRERKYGFGERA